ncbi:hypothetical protein QL285_062352 [Trifolium repens]|nr:hypothetical protein QL285_062352 [Trifolium repens]
MDSSSLFISLIFIFSLLISSSKPTLSSTLGVDAISRTLQIQHRQRSPPSVQEAAARSLLSRLLPSHSSSFHFRILSKKQCGGEYCFTINNHPSFATQGSPQIQYVTFEFLDKLRLCLF